MHTVLREARLKNNACSNSTTTPHSSFTQSLQVPCLKRVDFKEKLVDAAEIKAILDSGGDGLASLTGEVSSGPSAEDEVMKDSTTPRTTPGQAKTAINLAT